MECGTKRLKVFCDVPEHADAAPLAFLMRHTFENEEGKVSRIWKPANSHPMHGAEPLWDGVEYQDLHASELVQVRNAGLKLSFGEEGAYFRASQILKLELRHRWRFMCPLCQNITVELKFYETDIPDGGYFMSCPVLDQIMDAGLEHVTLRFLAHAVSYGVK